eukprot:SAG31_NODE_25836_length_453_cov_0.731638_1_plen_65_part_10
MQFTEAPARQVVSESGTWSSEEDAWQYTPSPATIEAECRRDVDKQGNKSVGKSLMADGQPYRLFD